jgi:hypothetical protein
LQSRRGNSFARLAFSTDRLQQVHQENVMRATYKLAGTLAVTALVAMSQVHGAAAQTPPTSPPAATPPSAAAAKSGAVTVTPGTAGPMDKAVGGLATSAGDVKAQTEGKPTAAEVGKGGKPDQPVGSGAPVTTQSPGTVGASPGTTAPMNKK